MAAGKLREEIHEFPHKVSDLNIFEARIYF